MGATVALIGTTLAVSKQHFVKDFFMTRLRLIAGKTIAEDAARDAQAQALAAREEASSWRSSHDAIVVRMDSMNTLIAALQLQSAESIAVRVKLDAAVDWIGLLLNYIVALEGRLITAGVDMRGMSCPPVPKILADKFNVPEVLR